MLSLPTHWALQGSGFLLAAAFSLAALLPGALHASLCISPGEAACLCCPGEPAFTGRAEIACYSHDLNA